MLGSHLPKELDGALVRGRHHLRDRIDEYAFKHLSVDKLRPEYSRVFLANFGHIESKCEVEHACMKKKQSQVVELTGISGASMAYLFVESVDRPMVDAWRHQVLVLAPSEGASGLGHGAPL